MACGGYLPWGALQLATELHTLSLSALEASDFEREPKLEAAVIGVERVTHSDKALKCRVLINDKENNVLQLGNKIIFFDGRKKHTVLTVTSAVSIV